MCTPDANGNLISSHLPNNWLKTLVNNAHTNGVKVSISVGGGYDSLSGGSYSDYYSAATGTATNLNKLVGEIANFVETWNLDGVDINWEYPSGATQWNNCITLLSALKNHQKLQCKRISIALRAGAPATFPNQTIPQQIWQTVNAIHLMTYDMNSAGWKPHSNAANSNASIDAWSTWGNTNGLGDAASKEKLFVGCAFYGYYDINNGYYPNGITYKQGASDSDNTTSLPIKVNHCYDNGYGGVFIWELGQDEYISTTPTLLNAIWVANTAKGGYPAVMITTQPAASSTFYQSHTCSSLSVVANKPCIDVLYQWYSNSTNSNSGGTLINGATNENFTLPFNLTTGTYYYYCELKSGRSTVKSNVAKVIVTSNPPTPVISGATLICYNITQSNISANNWQTGYYWDKSSNISLTNGDSYNPTATALSHGAGWVSVKTCSGVELVRKSVWVGAPMLSYKCILSDLYQ